MKWADSQSAAAFSRPQKKMCPALVTHFKLGGARSFRAGEGHALALHGTSLSLCVAESLASLPLRGWEPRRHGKAVRYL
jgi:hypothetical protein